MLHGRALRLQALSVDEVVHNYGDVCQSVTELALETDAPISTDDFRTLNRCLDDAIAGAVTEYGRARHESSSEHGSGQQDRLDFFAQELRNLTGTAVMAFEVLKTGNVGVAGSTGQVLHRSLVRMTHLVERSLAEVRLTQGVEQRETFLVAAFIHELAADAVLAASAKEITLTVEPVADAIAIAGDRQVLTAVLHNVLQNAFEFTRPNSSVTLRVVGRGERVLIEVEDECGGLPGRVDHLFRPFEQRRVDRTGLGLGLAFCRWAVESNHGVISTRNLPNKGCVLIVDLPLCSVLSAG